MPEGAKAAPPSCARARPHRVRGRPGLVADPARGSRPTFRRRFVIASALESKANDRDSQVVRHASWKVARRSRRALRLPSSCSNVARFPKVAPEAQLRRILDKSWPMWINICPKSAKCGRSRPKVAKLCDQMLAQTWPTLGLRPALAKFGHFCPTRRIRSDVGQCSLELVQRFRRDWAEVTPGATCDSATLVQLRVSPGSPGVTFRIA